jgi:hypothetical protein
MELISWSWGFKKTVDFSTWRASRMGSRLQRGV